MNLLKPLVRAVENCGPLYENFSLADKVTYKYFTGCKAMFDSNFKEGKNFFIKEIYFFAVLASYLLERLCY